MALPTHRANFQVTKYKVSAWNCTGDCAGRNHQYNQYVGICALSASEMEDLQR